MTSFSGKGKELGESQRDVVVVEEKMYVAVSKEIKENRSILKWALQNSGGKKVCIVHVHQPSQKIPTPFGYMLASTLGEKEVESFREKEREKMSTALNEYLRISLQTGVRIEKVYIEADSIEKGIIQLVEQHNIGKLVIGAAADKHYSRKMIEIKSKKAIYVKDNAPAFCHIWFICNGYLIHTREAAIPPESPIGEYTLVTIDRDGGAGSPTAPPYDNSPARWSTGSIDGPTSTSGSTRDEFPAWRPSLASPKHPNFLFHNDSGKASRLESMYLEECMRRKEVEAELAKARTELEWMKNHVEEMPKTNEELESVELGKVKEELEYLKNNVVGELRSAVEQKALLENQIRNATFLLEMLGEKLASAIFMMHKYEEQ